MFYKLRKTLVPPLPTHAGTRRLNLSFRLADANRECQRKLGPTSRPVGRAKRPQSLSFAERKSYAFPKAIFKLQAAMPAVRKSGVAAGPLRACRKSTAFPLG